ncbi:MAG: dTMP kinase [Gemmatales bacterium]|nr:dTMP kinase [Gemmatales bacterium]MDW7993567.1 dTMP kinase [Gemmatales bacterium]
MSRGWFFCVEGVDGAGKTTQCQLLADWLRERGYGVVLCRDPGGTAIGERIREILLSVNGASAMTELLLFMASRAQLVTEVIRPALQRGEIVLADRFLLASVVYQGYAGGICPERIWELGRWATAETLPDLTVVLDLPPERARQRKAEWRDQFEQRGMEFLGRVRAGYLAEAQRCPATIVVVNADRSPAEVQADLRSEVGRVLSGNTRS